MDRAPITYKERGFYKCILAPFWGGGGEQQQQQALPLPWHGAARDMEGMSAADSACGVVGQAAPSATGMVCRTPGWHMMLCITADRHLDSLLPLSLLV